MSARKSTTRVVSEVVIAVIVLALVFAWSESLFADKIGPDDTPAAAARPELSPSDVATVRSVDVPLVVEALGTVRPARGAVVASQVLGVVESVSVEEGAVVAAGDPLVRIRADELSARSRAASERVQAAVARLEQARRDLARIAALAEREAATRVEHEQARTAVAVAEAEVSASRQAARGERTVASWAAIRAPIAGRVVTRHVDPGDLASPGRPLVTLETRDRQRVEVPLDERHAARLGIGDVVGVRLESLGLDLSGRVDEVEPEADPRSRTVLVKIALPVGPDGSAAARTGTFGRARFIVGRRDGLAVSSEAVRRVGGLATVRVLTDDLLLVRHVRVGAELGEGLVEVLSGVTAGEQVALAKPRERAP